MINILKLLEIALKMQKIEVFFMNENSPIRKVFKYTLNDKRPILFMLVGLPGSGKSQLAKCLTVNRGGESYISPLLMSSDTLRNELFGSESVQDKNDVLFVELHRRIKENLKNGYDVIYDATNIHKKQRTAFLRELKNISCYKVCIAVMTPYDLCLKRNELRERVVPESVIERMYKNWNPPDYREGFDEILFEYQYENDEQKSSFTLQRFFDKANYISHDNKHHKNTIGIHCLEVFNALLKTNSKDRNLCYAGLLHDIGKPFTKSELNIKGENDGDCHYYQHHCVGAYDSLFYLDVLNNNDNEDKTDISNLIYYHMSPFMAWKQSEKAKNKARQFLGEEMFNRVMQLHDADRENH